MTRLLCVLCLAVALSACRTATPELAPDDARAAYEAALAAGDADHALALLQDAAPTDLMAHVTLGEAYQRGYLTLRDTLGGPDTRLPIQVVPGQAALEGWRFKRHVEREAREGNPDALLMVARRGAESTRIVNGRLVEADLTPAQRDTASAIYQRLLDTDVDRFRLGLLAQALGDTVAYQRHVAEAAALGDPTACTFKVWFAEDGSRPKGGPAEELALYYDRVDACRPDHPIPLQAMGALRTLRAQIELGNPASETVLDSLHHLGTFERHPELADVLGPYSRPSAS